MRIGRASSTAFGVVNVVDLLSKGLLRMGRTIGFKRRIWTR